MEASDGKKYNTDCTGVETLMRIKQWLAKIGYERMKEMSDPSTAINSTKTIIQDLKEYPKNR